MLHEGFIRKTMRGAKEGDDWEGVDCQDQDVAPAGAPAWPVVAIVVGYSALIVAGIALAT